MFLERTCRRSAKAVSIPSEVSSDRLQSDNASMVPMCASAPYNMGCYFRHNYLPQKWRALLRWQSLFPPTVCATFDFSSTRTNTRHALTRDSHWFRQLVARHCMQYLHSNTIYLRREVNTFTFYMFSAFKNKLHGIPMSSCTVSASQSEAIQAPTAVSASSVNQLQRLQSS